MSSEGGNDTKLDAFSKLKRNVPNIKYFQSKSITYIYYKYDVYTSKYD